MQALETRPAATTLQTPFAAPGRGALAGSVVVLVAYFALLHVLVVRELAPLLAIALVVGPWLAALPLMLRPLLATPAARRAGVLLGIMVVASLALAGRRYGDRLAGRVDVVLFCENLVFLLVLCGLFATTLRVGHEALITRLARMARGGELPPQALRYTRRVTLVWAAFFAAMALLSAILFTTQSRTVWSTFVNLLIWPSMAVVFAVEYAVRIRVLRDIPHIPMMSAVTAFRQRDAAFPAATRGPCE